MPDTGRIAAALGVVALAVAVGFRPAAASHLWAHMTQHLMLVVVVAPLFAVVLLRWRTPRTSTVDLAVWTVLHSVALWTWHLPGPFDASLRSEIVHGLAHLTLLGTALGFWWTAFATLRHGQPGVGVAAVFVTAMQGIALGGLMTLASRPWYDGFPLSDQQVAGVIMWCRSACRPRPRW